MYLDSSPKKKFTGNQNNKQAWISIIIFAFITVALLIIGAAKILSLLYPLGAIVVGIFLYKRYPIIYISFTLWLLFVGHLVIRLIGYKLGGFGPFGGSLLLVPFITSLALIKTLPSLYKNGDGLPFIICLGSVFYGCLIKFVRQPLGDFNGELTAVLGYLSPILFGLYLYINWRNYPRYRDIIQKTFFWIVLVTSVYGIWQFLIAPAWDIHFARITWGENSWMGKTEPLGMRVNSTMSSPYSFALNLLPGLLLLNTSTSKFRWLAIAPGYIAFFLTTYRTAWYSLVVATLVLFVSLKAHKQFYLLFCLVIICLLSVFLVNIEPFSKVITDRIETFSNLSNDSSALARIESFNLATNILMTEFVGFGIAGESMLDNMGVQSTNNEVLSGNDMGFYAILANFGWIGTIPYLVGILLILHKLFWKFSANFDMFALSARAIVFASVIRVMTSSILIYEFAFPLWFFIGLAMAAHKYHQNLNYTDSQKQP